MNRRDLLGLFAGLPFMEWLKPKPDVTVVFVEKWMHLAREYDASHHIPKFRTELVRSRCDLEGTWPVDGGQWPTS